MLQRGIRMRAVARRTFASAMSLTPPRVAIVLSGSGVYDGSEITESTATLIHVSRLQAKFQCFAPDKDQHHAVDHTQGIEHADTRNVLVESARIARGDVKPLSDLNPDDYDGLIIPGGFGAAKNLSSWAIDGIECKVDPDMEKCIDAFHASGKPIGACCIAPTLLAKCIPGCTVTVGSGNIDDEANWPYAGIAKQIQELGCTHVETDITGVTVDGKNNLVTSAAYMYNGKPYEIHDSVGLMVEKVLTIAYGAKLK